MILCCGEALIDMIPRPTVEGVDGFVPHSGGAIFNTAIALGRLGVQVGLLSGVSNDLFGQQLATDLAASNVETGLLIRSSQPTTLAFVRLTNGHAQYTFYDENSAGRMIQTADMPPLGDVVQALYFGGISLCSEPGADAYADLCLREAPSRLVMLDPNIRPGFISDEQGYRARLSKMIAVADIVKVSDEDLAWIFPELGQFDAQVDALRAMGPTLVIITKGADGSSAYRPSGPALDAASLRVDVVDTVGAGDTFNAGVLAHLAETGALSKASVQALSDAQIKDMLGHGARVAAVTVSRAGANPPWAREL